ncbi:hypothetical protein ACJ41O_003388 [Fusarium nematophilum]
MDANSADYQQGQGVSPQSRPESPAPRAPRILACVLCQHRKIRCDRRFPCANCIKANVLCTPSTPAPVRKRRRPNHVLQERLTKLEALLEQYAGTSSPGPQDASSQTPEASALAQEAPGAASTPSSLTPLGGCSDERLAHPRPAGKLVIQDGSVKFMDSYIWGIIHENLQELRKIIDSETPEEQDPLLYDAPTPDDNVDLLLNAMSAVHLDDLVPLPVQVFRLWQVFIERVNPITKLIHVPTLQPVIIEAVTNHTHVSSKSRALLFAIYLAAVVSMSDKEARTMLGIPKEEAIRRFTAGVKAALTKVNFLIHYDTVTLQALVLYLISLQGRSNHHAVWVLSGVVIRIAHKMGLHRDGETLNLSPFETEMRRRVWWQIITLDSMYATTSGLKETLLPWGSDTKVPQNLNDADFGPGSVEIHAYDGPTEMAFCMMMYEVVGFVKNHPVTDLEHVVLGNQAAEPGTPEYAACLAALDRFKALAEEFEERLILLETRYCNPSAGPVHTLALGIRRCINKEVRSMFVPMRETPEWGTEVNNAQDNIFRIWLGHHETIMSFYDISCNTSFIWFHKCHFQVDSFLFLVNQLVNRPSVGMFADRSWRLIERFYHYHDELFDMTKRQHAQVAYLVLKAWEARESSLLQLDISFDVPACVLKLKNPMPQPDPQSSSQDLIASQPYADGADGNGLTPAMQLDFTTPWLDPVHSDWNLSNQLNDGQGANNQNLTTPPVFGFFGNYTGW